MISCEFYLELKDYAPKIIVAVLFCALTVYSCFFSPAAFYAQGPRMDRQRVFSIFSSGNSSFRDCFYYFQSAGIRFEALLFNLNLRVSHFCNSKSRKQSAKHRHCSTQEICKFGFFVPTKKFSAKRLTASQHINLSAEVIFTFSSGYWVWILSDSSNFYPVHRRPIS